MRRRVHSNPINIGGDAFTPSQLGSSLIAWFDADRSDSITQSSGLVSAWNDLITGFSLVQTSAAQKPIYSATGYNGRPGVTFDGTDDILLSANFPASYPTSADPCWMWAVVDQQRAAASPNTGTIFQYGDPGLTANTRRISREQSGAENRFACMIGTGAGTSTSINPSVVFLGRHYVLGKASGTTAQAIIDETSVAATAAIPATTFAAGEAAIGGAVNGGNFLLGTVSTVIMTLPLSAANEAAMQLYLSRRV
jgi:hypothetical protein